MSLTKLKIAVSELGMSVTKLVMGVAKIRKHLLNGFPS
jgi:hypothetical protein